MELKVSELTEIVGGRLLAGSPETVVRHVTVDSRVSLGDDLFVPLRGEVTDGHRFIGGALENGSAASLTDEEVPIPRRGALIRVKDTQEALEKLGAYHRDSYRGTVVGVTGSVGKTTTREMTKLALSAGGTVTGAEKNLNSLQGLPMTFCHLDQTADRAVVELGINHPGEMDVLAGIARPNVAVVTNIGVSHIEFLGSRENIAAEKLKICSYLGPEDYAVLNAEDDMLLRRKGKTPFRTLWYGFGEEADIRADGIRDRNLGQSFRVTVREPEWARGTYEAVLQVPGRHNILNALAALGAALACGIAPADALEELASYGGMKRRLEIRHAGGLTIIDDAYNAIVSSVKAALDVLCRVPGRKGALLADMREVGSHSEEFHREVGEYAARLPIDYFIGFGDAIRVTEEILTDAGKTVFHAETAEDAVDIIRQVCADGDTLLVKGSLSMGLDRVVEAVCSET